MPAHPRFPIAPDHDSNGPHDLLQRRSCWLHLLKLGGTVIGTVATGTVRHEAHPSHAGPLPDRVACVSCRAVREGTQGMCVDVCPSSVCRHSRVVRSLRTMIRTDPMIFSKKGRVGCIC